MDPFSWIGDQISNVGNWLSSGNNALNTASLGNSIFGGTAGSKPVGTGTTTLSAGLERATTSPTGFRNQGDQPSRSKPAEVVGKQSTDGPIFRDKSESDPYMLSFRRLMNDSKNTISLPAT